MKKSFVVVVLMSTILSCQESKENTVQKLSKPYNKRIGEQIPSDVAFRWVRNFNTITMGGRTSSAYSLEASALSDILGNASDRLGVVFHHGLDESGSHRLFMVALDNDGVLFKNRIMDLTNGKELDKTKAIVWAAKYSQQHPATPWYHFFGSDMFSEIQSNEAFDYIDVVRGLNENNEEQILLFVYNTNGSSGGRSESEVLVYDKSNPCPPCDTN